LYWPLGRSFNLRYSLQFFSACGSNKFYVFHFGCVFRISTEKPAKKNVVKAFWAYVVPISDLLNVCLFDLSLSRC